MAYNDVNSVEYKRMKAKIEYAINMALRSKELAGFVKYVMFKATEGSVVAGGSVICIHEAGELYEAETAEHLKVIMGHAAEDEASPVYRLKVLNISTSEEPNARAEKLVAEIEESHKHARTLTCFHKGRKYKPGETIDMTYAECVCVDGEWECNDGPGMCGIFGKGMVETFDERMIQINGSCTFKLAADCTHARDFAIFSKENYLCTPNEKRKVRSLRVEFVGNYIRIGPDDIYVNDVRVTSDYTDDSIGVSVHDLTSKFRITIGTIGVIEWDKDLTFDIKINSKYEGSTCGVCGNDNGDKNDDNHWKQYAENCHHDEGCMESDHFKMVQVYDKTCLDLQKVSFPEFYSDVCSNLKGALIKACLTCEKDIIEECMHMSNIDCIRHHQKKCVNIEMSHYFKTCFSMVFGGVSKRDVRSLRVKEAIESINIWEMTIDDINDKLSQPELWE